MRGTEGDVCAEVRMVRGDEEGGGRKAEEDLDAEEEG